MYNTYITAQFKDRIMTRITSHSGMVIILIKFIIKIPIKVHMPKANNTFFIIIN